MNMRRVLAVVVVLGAVGACVRIPPVRYLPTTISAIYIPMFENGTYEPGLEEKLTMLTQEEFLMDGRLDVVPRHRSDAVLVGKLRKFSVQADRFGRDEFPLTSRILAIADVALHDPSDREKETPLMTWKDIDVEFSYASDARSVREVSPDDAYEEAMRQLARQVVYAVITRPPEEYEELRAAQATPKPAPPRRILGRETLEPVIEDTGTTTAQSPDESGGVPRDR